MGSAPVAAWSRPPRASPAAARARRRRPRQRAAARRRSGAGEATARRGTRRGAAAAAPRGGAPRTRDDEQRAAAAAEAARRQRGRRGAPAQPRRRATRHTCASRLAFLRAFAPAPSAHERLRTHARPRTARHGREEAARRVLAWQKRVRAKFSFSLNQSCYSAARASSSAAARPPQRTPCGASHAPPALAPRRPHSSSRSAAKTPTQTQAPCTPPLSRSTRTLSSCWTAVWATS